jgi:hypothetical protein
MKWSWINFRLLSRKFTGLTEDTTKNLSQDSLCTGRVRNPNLPNVNQQLCCFTRYSDSPRGFGLEIGVY